MQSQATTGHSSLKLGCFFFSEDILPRLTENDCVIFLGEDIADSLVKQVAQTSARLGALSVGRSCPAVTGLGSRLIAHAHTDLEQAEFFDDIPLLKEFAIKLMANTVSTGANIVKGAVYGNMMINLTLSNNKVMRF